jgi:hypothetical protein
LAVSQSCQPLTQEAALIGPPDQGSAGCSGPPLAAGTEDGDRLRPALHLTCWQCLEGDLGLRRLPGRGIADDVVEGRGHEAGGKVYHPADHRVLATQVAADRAAERPPGSDTDGVAHPEPAKFRLDPKRRLDGTDGVVLVGDGREAEGGHQRRALIVDAELVDRALVLVQRRLHGTDQVVCPPHCAWRDVIQVREPQEQHADVAQLRQPGALAGVQPSQDRAGYVASQRRTCHLPGGRDHRRRCCSERLDRGNAQGNCLPGACGQLLAGADVTHLVERLGGEHHITRSREMFDGTRLGYRRPTDHELPAVELTTQVRGRHLACSDPDPNRQVRPSRQLAGMEDPLHGQPTAGGLSCHPRQTLVGRPEGKQRVASELHHIAAVVGDQLDQLAKAAVQQLGELLDTASTGLRKPLSERRKARYVGEQDRRGELLIFGFAQQLVATHKAPGGERGNIAGDREWVAAIPLPSWGDVLLHFLPSRPGSGSPA